MSNSDKHTSDFVGLMMSAQPKIRAYIRMMVYNPSDVNDILQEVAAVGWQKYEQFDTTRSFDAWALGIARNCVFDYLREQGKRASPLTAEAMGLLEAEAADVAASSTEIEAALEVCLAKLAANDHRIVRMRFEQAESNRGVSKLLGMSEPTVCRVLNRIYAQLLLCIKRQERSPRLRP